MKNMLRFKLPGRCLVLLLALAFRLQAQPAARAALVRGTLTQCAPGEAVRAVRPVAGGYLNYFYAASAPLAAVAEGRFELSFLPRPGGELVSLQSKCLPQLYAFVAPGDTVTLRQGADGGSGPGEVVFGGANAAGNNLLSAGRLFNRRAGVDEKRVLDVLKASPTAATALRGLRRELRRATGQLDSVRARGLISAACCATLRALTEQQLLFWSGGLLQAYFNDASRTKLGTRLNDAAMRQIAQALNTEFDPFQARYQELGISLSTAHAKCVLLETGVLTGPGPPAARHWQQYAAQFKDINSAFGAYDFAPVGVQARLLGNELLTALVFRPMSDEQYAAVFQDYVQRFPASPYVGVLTQALLREQPAAGGPAAPGSAPATANPNQDLGYYDAATNQLGFAPVAGLDTVTNLAALVRRQFPGRAVFVDFWASWCSPCIAEFRGEAATHEFLARHNIEPLYVALNNANYRPKWRDFVVENKSSAAVQAALNKQFSGIPRYMLFDQSGKLVDDNLPRPSTGEEMRRQIAQKLRLK